MLRRLADSPHRPVLVVTPPDSRRGRGRKLSPPPAAEAARELGLDLHQAPDVNSPGSLEAIRAVDPRALAVCAFGQLIKEPLLSEWTMLNVHPSLVPRWRGAAPIERALMAGDERTGVTIMRVTAGLDSGPIALAEEVEVDPLDDYASLSGRLAELGGELLVRAFDALEAGEIEFTEQDDSRGHLCGEGLPGGAAPAALQARGGARANGAGALSPHRRLPRARGGRPSGSARRTDAPGMAPKPGRSRCVTTGSFSVPPMALWSWMSSSRRVESRCA